MNRSLTTLIVSGFMAAALAFVLAAQSAGAATTAKECGVNELSARITNQQPAAGNRYATLTLTNTSRATCRTGGWVGLGLENANGEPVTTNAVRIDSSAERPIELKPGQRTMSHLHWSDVEGTGDHAGGPCFKAPSRILVTPPNSYSSLKLSWTGGFACEAGTIDVTPLSSAR
jgi:hypothetical protein